MIGYIYSFTINNKMYIGKTYRSLSKRLKQHKYDAFTNKTETPLYYAIRKYGWEIAKNSFKVVEEIENDTLEELNKILCERENYNIDKFNTMLPNGYNCHYSNHIKPTHITNRKERYEKTSKSLKGKYMNCEYSSKKVICEQTGEIFPSISEFARSIGTKPNNIKNLQYNKWTLQYIDENFDINNFVKKPYYDVNKKMNSRNKNVICLEDNMIFKNTRAVSEFICGDKEKIRANVINACKYGWKLYGKSYRYYIQDNIVPSMKYSKKNKVVKV